MSGLESNDRLKALRLSSRDNLALALEDLPQGTRLQELGIKCRELIPAGHKVALSSIETGEAAYKYGQIIGFALSPIATGKHVHTHNLGVDDFSRDYAIGQNAVDSQTDPPAEPAYFQGIMRPNGRVATRNYLGILATVNCSAGVARFIADDFNRNHLSDFPRIDGAVALTHGGGCGTAVGSEGMELLQRTLAGYARHPNFAGILLLGLGCEGNQIDDMAKTFNLMPAPGLHHLNIQDLGGTRRTVAHAVGLLKEMALEANQVQRERVPARHLIIGLECGGSDAFSGITANPALGAAMDILVQQGGTAVLSETPEIYGAEHLLTRRAISREVGEKLVEHIRWWEEYAARNGVQLNNNPSPGNKAGGLTTILEKSLGAVTKGGTSTLKEVYAYAEPIKASGLVFMDTPGYDPVSITGMVAGGVNLICFTTGRGSVFGSKPVPSLKLATNTEVFYKLSEDMDLNCGSILDGEMSIEQMGRRIFGAILEAASGKPTASEKLGFGEMEFVPWQIGAII